MSRRRALSLAALILVIYLVVQLAGLRSMGLTDDDDFYVPAGISYAEWLGRALRFEARAWTREGIDAAFQLNREHPPFAKYVFGICHFVFRGVLGPTDAARVGTVLFSTLAAAMLLAMAISHLGRRRGLEVGGLAVLMLLTLPRFFFHSHAATLDVPVSAMYLAAGALALRSERSTRAAWWVGPVFGLAAATKLNAPFLLLAYLPFVFLVRWRRGGAAPDGSDPTNPAAAGLRLPSLPLSLFSMAILGVGTFFLSWPWIWTEVPKRVSEYVSFHLHHYGIYFLYFGQIYSKDPFAPWHSPFVMAATTIPLATSVLAIAGLIFAIPRIILRLRFRDGPDDDRRMEGDLLIFVVLNVVTTIGVVAFAGTPIYGGEKLFMPFFPFWCLLAGYGAERARARIGFELGPSVGPRGRWIVAGALGLAAASGLALQLRFGAYALSEYNGLAGGLRGATATGFERQYYDVAHRDLVAWLSREGPPNLKVHFLPNNWEYVRTYRWYKQAGELRPDITVVDGEQQADWVVITHERRFARYGEDLERYRTRPVLQERLLDGTPIWSVVKAR